MKAFFSSKNKERNSWFWKASWDFKYKRKNDNIKSEISFIKLVLNLERKLRSDAVLKREV